MDPLSELKLVADDPMDPCDEMVADLIFPTDPRGELVLADPAAPIQQGVTLTPVGPPLSPPGHRTGR
jgi:hypothetical protein